MSSLKRANDSASPPATPAKRPKPIGLTAYYHTHFSKDSNVYSTHTVDLTITQQIERDRKQDDLKGVIDNELRNYTFEEDWVHQHFCPVLDEQVETVVNALCGTAWESTTDDGFSLRNWPTGSTGSDFYGPFANLLNELIRTDNKYHSNEQSIYLDVEFFACARAMTESVSGEHTLKPHILAVSSRLEKSKASWYETYLVGVVAEDWPQVLSQAGSHARCLFAASDHRVFVPVLGLNHVSAEFRLCFFHRSGVVATKAMVITTQNGFREFVATMMGMWRWTEQSAAGFVPGQSPTGFSFNNEVFRIRAVCCRRQAIRGRGTTVYALCHMEPSPGHRRFHPCDAKDAPWSNLNPFDHSTEPIDISSTVQIPHTLPDLFVLKCAHQPPTTRREDVVFGSAKGYIGVPDVLTTYELPGFDIPEGKSVRFWPVFPGAKERPYEHRVHRHIIIETVGQRLHPNLTCKELGYALLHAMIGHCSLFTVGKYLHCDVSDGNILLLRNTARSEWKIPSLLEGIVKSQECTAVLVDGDIVKPWIANAPPSSDHSGTPPFLSARLLELWQSNMVIDHMPIDDLESFAWVLLYNLIAWTPQASRTQKELNWWNGLNNHDLQSLHNAKQGALFEWAHDIRFTILPLSSALQKYSSLLHSWLKLSVDFSTQYDVLRLAGNSAEACAELYNQAYVKFVQVGQDEIAKLPDDRISDLLLTESSPSE